MSVRHSERFRQDPPFHFSPCSAGRHACAHTPVLPPRQACQHAGTPTHMHTCTCMCTHRGSGTQVPFLFLLGNGSKPDKLASKQVAVSLVHCSSVLGSWPTQGRQARAGLPSHGPWDSGPSRSSGPPQGSSSPELSPGPGRTEQQAYMAAIGNSMGRGEGAQSQNGQWGRHPCLRATWAKLGLKCPQLSLLPNLKGPSQNAAD